MVQQKFTANSVFLLIISVSYLVFSFFATGCGKVNVGLGGGTPNDAVPSTQLLGQALFVGLNGQTVSGTASIYVGKSSGYIVRLGSLVVPNETGLVVQVYPTSGGLMTTFALSSYTGTKNYNISGASNLSFGTIYIYSASANLEYGSAMLQ